MNQAAATGNTHSVDLEKLRLQLEEDGKCYDDNRTSTQPREQLLQTLQTNDCREIITQVVDGSDLSNSFVEAAYRGHVDILEAILNHGMNINIKDEVDWTALIGASCNGHEQCIRFLLDHNASVDLQDEDGHTALMYACNSNSGHTKIVEMLLEKHANLDLQNKSGRTALAISSMRGHKEIVQVLLNHGADIELKDNDGKTALDLAEDEEIKEMIRNHVSTRYVLK